MKIKLKADLLPIEERTWSCSWVVRYAGLTYKLHKFTDGGTFWDCELDDISLFSENTKADLITSLEQYLNNAELIQ